MMDIIEALEAAKIRYHQSDSDDDEITICCPFCVEEGQPDQDTRYRLGINVSTGEMHCFNCDKSSRDAEYTFNELHRILETGDIEQTRTSHHKRKHVKHNLPEDFKVISPTSDDYWNRKAYKYVRSRGVTKRQIRKKKIGYSIVDKHLHHRIVFPIYWKGKLQGLVGRSFTSKQTPTYKNSVGEKALCNLPETPQDTIVVVEGLFDALAVERAVLESLEMDSAATLGHTLTSKQLKQLKKYKVIILWYDPDDAGIDGLLHDYKQIKEWYPSKTLKFVVPKTYYGKEDSDPSDLSIRERMYRVKRAKRFTNEWIEKLKSWRAFDE